MAVTAVLRRLPPRPWGWGLLVLLVALTQAALLWLSFRHEHTQQQERLDELNATTAGEFRHRLRESVDRLQDLIADVPWPDRFDAAGRSLLRDRRGMLRIELRTEAMALQRSLVSPYRDLPDRSLLPRGQQQGELLAACRTARDIGMPRLSGSYYLGAPIGLGTEVVDMCVPIVTDRRTVGYITATVALSTVLEQVLAARSLGDHALVLTDPDGSRLASAGPRLDAVAPSAERLLEVAGLTVSMQLRQRRHSPWLPEPALAVGLVLSAALVAVLALLMRDMRRRVAAERELAQALALRHAMEDSLVSSARLAMMGEMASLLSHELNQPLTAIVGYAHGTLNMLEQPVAEHDAPMLRLALQRIAEQGDRAGRVIKSVHDFVRRRQTTREARPAGTLIDAILPLVRLQAHRSGASVDVAPPDGPVPWVRCDPTMIEQVLLNLARNGLQAIEAAGRPLDQRRLVLSVQAPPETQRAMFSVLDHGTGVPAPVAERLFTPFFSTREGGLGLGLNMCRTAVEQHGGELAFENVHDADGHCVGACFRFTLPVAPRTAAEETDHAARG